MRQQSGAIARSFTNLDWDVQTVQSSGNLLAGTKRFFLSGTNRVGRNYLSDPKTVTILDGDKLSFTIASTVRGAGEDLWRLLISAADTTNPQDAVMIAEIKVILDDQQTQINLPLPFDLLNPTDIETNLANMTVATVADLDTVVNPINGQLKSVDNLGGAWRRYDSNSGLWVPHYFSTQFTYISNIQGPEGADQLLGADLIIKPPKIDTSGSQTTTIPLRYEIVNGEAGQEGSSEEGSLNLRIAINGSPLDENGRFYGPRFADIYKYKLIGYRDVAERTLDVSMLNAGVTQSWHPELKRILIPDPLPVGSAIVLDLWIDTPTLNLNQAGYNAGDILGVSFDKLARSGQPTDLVYITGDNKVLAEGGGLIALPDKLTDGAAIIGRLIFEAPIQNGIFNSALQDQEDQLVIINSAPGGTVRTSESPASLLTSEGIRAVFSTRDGFSDPSEISDEYVLTAENSLEFTINHPVDINGLATIRSNYPDPLVRGRTDAKWQNLPFRVFLYKGSQLYQQNTLEISNGDPSQTITIQNLDDFTPINTGLPSGTNTYGPNYSLYTPLKPSIGIPVNVPGVLQPDIYRIAIVYYYTSPNNIITRIDHQAPGTLAYMPATIENLLAVFPLWSNTHLTTESARELDSSTLINGSVHMFVDKNYAPYVFRNDVFLDDDGVSAISPQGFGTFFPQPTLGFEIASQTQVFPRKPRLIFGYGFTIEENIISDAIVVSINPDVIVQGESTQYLLSPEGEFYESPEGEVYTTQ